MMTLTITITGEDTGDLELALDEVRDKVQQEFREGWDKNESGSYRFRVEDS